MEDILEYVLRKGAELGAEYVEARYQSDIESQILLKNGVPEVSADAVERGVGLRVLVKGCLGFAYVNRLDRQTLRKAVSDAVSMARASTPRSPNVKMSDEKLVSGSDVKKPRIGFDSVDVSDKIALLKEADAAAVEAAEKVGVKLVSRIIEVGRWDTEKIVMNTDGGNVTYRVCRAVANYHITAYHSTERLRPKI
jgi:TldD protein